MLALAIGLGIYAYSIFFLGILGMLTREAVLIDTAFFAGVGTLYLWRHKRTLLTCIESLKKLKGVSVVLILLLVSQATVNLVGALGPELAFDALWYHLTLPKIYLLHGAISYISGNLLYYSAMPQLTEMFYIATLTLQGETLAKCVHLLFGILACLALYIFAHSLFKKQNVAIFAVVLFYANLVVGWESITAYSDLTLAFFTLMSLWAFYKWIGEKKMRWLYVSAILLGFAVATKLLAIGTLGIMLALITITLFKNKASVLVICQSILQYFLVTILVVSPWLLYAFVSTGNPFFPFFSDINPVAGSYITFNISQIIPEIWQLFVISDDPILPIYLILVPLIFVVRKKIAFSFQLLFIYTFLAFLFWFSLPKIGGGRFLLPYLPAYSLLASYIIFAIPNKFLHKVLVAVVIVLAITSIMYRGLANSKYVPVLFGVKAKEQFLKENLNFSFGDFYDTDGYFQRHITMHDKVLLYGFHNLYYIDFPFIDASYVKKGDRYNFVAVQGGKLPVRHGGAILVYENPITHVALYNLGRFEVYE